MKCFAILFVVFLSSFPLIAQDNSATAVLIDISRSVSPEDFEKGKTATQSFIDATKTPDTISVYAFGNTTRKLDVANLHQLEATESYTQLYDAVYDAAQDLDKTSAARRAIVIVSDGLDTKSVTVLEDITAFANDRGIALYAVGIGNPNRKTLERMAKLTGGKYFGIGEVDLVTELQKSVASQKLAESNEVQAPPAPVAPPPGQQVTQPAVVLPPVTPDQESSVSEESKGFPLWAIGLIVGAVVALGVVGFLIIRSTREVRLCPNCGKKLEPYQTICPQCPNRETMPVAVSRTVPPSDGTQELKVSESGEEDLIPIEWLERKPVTEEMLSKTFVLMETPMLIVNKGKTQGQSYSLNRAFPISIGRSRVNEIRLDDITVSSQHCRIIPENGKHVLYDLGSTNGTFVNESKVSKAALKEGDTIKVGETHFLYKIEQFRN